jgi:hypothetical protein
MATRGKCFSSERGDCKPLRWFTISSVREDLVAKDRSPKKETKKPKKKK